MTIEEKAKRYDEAIKIAKSKIRNDKNHVLYEKDIIDIFSELKESDDEKIKRTLIELVKCNERNGYTLINNVSTSSMLNWLEKQGEPNPYSGTSFEYNGHTWGMCARDGGVEIGYDKQLIASINPIREKDKFDNFSKVANDNPIGNNAKDFIMCTASNHGI